jgi:flagellar protein FliL
MADNLDEPEGKAKEGQPAGGGGGSNKLLIIVIAGFLLFMILAGAGFFILWKKLPNPEGTKADANEETTQEEQVPLTVGPVFSLEPFVVNLADPVGNRYLRAKMTLELGSEELLEKMDKLVFPVRDQILTILSSKKYLEINTRQGKIQLRSEIATAADGLLGKGSVKKVYFSDLVVE